MRRMHRGIFVFFLIMVNLIFPLQAEEWNVESYDANGLWLLWKNPSTSKTHSSQSYTTTIAIAPGTLVNIKLSPKSAMPQVTGIVTASAPARYRDVTLVSLTWTPDGTEKKIPPTEARFRIDFKPTSGIPSRSAFPPTMDSPAEIVLRSWLTNYPQSRNLRSTSISGSTKLALGKSAAEGPAPGAFLPKERLVIRTRAEIVEVLDYMTLLNNKVPLSKIDPRKMHLYKDGIEQPIFIEGEADGHWNPGDYIEFVGSRSKGQNSFNSFYTTTSAYILTWEGARPGLRAPRVPVASRTGGAIPIETDIAKQAKPYTVHVHLEVDEEILRIGSTSAEEIIDLGSRVQETELTDFWFWQRLGAQKDASELPFALENTPATQIAGSTTQGQTGALDSSGSLRFTINLKGITNNLKADLDHHLKFILNGFDISLVGGVNHDAIWKGQESYTWVSPPLNPGVLKAGPNKLIIQKVNDLKTIEGQLVENQDAYINYIELHYPANYKVKNDFISFSNSFADSLGTKQFTLTGFTSTAITIWDTQGRKLSNFKVTQQGDGYQVDFKDSLAGATSYIALTQAKRDVPSVMVDTLPDLLTPKEGADYIVITQKSMVGKALDSLLDFRRKQGLRCAVVFADQIYQAFGDGSMDPAAIRRFVMYAYQNWPRPAPLFLNLVGDASLWFEKHSGPYNITIVPTHLINIRGWGVAANDDYFTKVSGDDDISDLFVGRIPVSSLSDLSIVVRKTILSETARPEGHWRNKAFLISGYETTFMEQNYVLEKIAVENDRQYSRLDLFPGSPYYKNAAQRFNFFDQLDSGFNLVNFIGHGGGSVWSDAGVLTFKAMDEGKLHGDFPIPLVSSITCLTGYFEDPDSRSLGEEMIRLPKSGAVGFYGSSGYISNLAGQALSAEILRAATGNGLSTIGAIITQAETMVKLKTGDAFLPILAEFNLLGDPAFIMSYPSKEGNLNLTPKTLKGNGAFKMEGSAMALSTADAVATVYLGDSTSSAATIKVEKNKFSQDATLATPIPGIQNGKVIVNYWDGKQSRVMSSPFSTLDWLIDSVSIEPANAAPGDSVRISLRLNTTYAKTSFGGGVASFVVGGESAPLFPEANQDGLITSDGVHLTSQSKVVLDVPQTDLVHPKIYLGFRLNLDVLDDQGKATQTLNNLNSRSYSLPLSDLANLEFPAQAFRLPIQEKLGVWIAVHNKGLGTSTGFQVSMVRDVQSSSPITDTVTYTRKLAFGELDSIFFPMTDSMLHGKILRGILIASRPGELSVLNASQDTTFQLKTQSFSSLLDTLKLDTLHHFLTLAPKSPSHRIFAQTVSISSLPRHLKSINQSLPFDAIHIESETQANFILGQWDSLPPLPKVAGAVLPHWHYSPALNQTWVRLDTLVESGNLNTTLGNRNGYYALLNNSDVQAPIIQISSHGQVLLPDDYVPLNTPIDVTIRDGQGVDLLLHPPVMTSQNQIFDSLNNARDSGKNPFPTLARINFLPKRTGTRDSLFISATDISGNIAQRSLIYRLGDDLSIRDLGSYPNPFADTAIFVFSLTDFCEKVELKVYSRAGRLVRSLSEKNVVGYQEVLWDGREEGKKEIANGLYFLKVTAKAGDKESSKIFKLFKKQRK